MKKIFSKVFTALIYAEIGILAVVAPIVLSVVLCLLVYWLIAEILLPFIPAASDWSYMPSIYVGALIGSIAEVHFFFGDGLRKLFRIAPDSTLDRFLKSVWLVLVALAAPLLAPFAALVIARIVCLLFTAFIVFFGMTFLASLINPLFFILWIGSNFAAAVEMPRFCAVCLSRVTFPCHISQFAYAYIRFYLPFKYVVCIRSIEPSDV